MWLSFAKGCAALLVAATDHVAEQTWLGRMANNLFDADWNTEHRAIIWSAIVVVLTLAGAGLPLPEDIPLTLSGFTVFKQSGDSFVLLNYVLAFGAVVVPILAGDIVAYGMGRRWGFGLRDRFRLVRRVLSDKRMHRVQRWFDHYGNFTVFLGRQVAGVRFVTFFSAGAMRMPLSKFVLYDFLGCLVSVPVWLTLGGLAAVYGKEWLDVAAKQVGSGFLVGAVLMFLGLVFYVRLRAARRPQLESEVVELHPEAGHGEPAPEKMLRSAAGSER